MEHPVNRLYRGECNNQPDQALRCLVNALAYEAALAARHEVAYLNASDEERIAKGLLADYLAHRQAFHEQLAAEWRAKGHDEFADALTSGEWEHLAF
jgi:hypothetical protein